MLRPAFARSIDTLDFDARRVSVAAGVNILLALAIIAAPRVLPGASRLARLNDLAAGLIVIGLSLRRGPIRDRYGAWNRYVV